MFLETHCLHFSSTLTVPSYAQQTVVCIFGRFQLHIVGIAIMTEILLCSSLSPENIRQCLKVDPDHS
jgi:hypothetical protein